MKKLIIKEEITKEICFDFEPKIKKWLEEKDFKRKFNEIENCYEYRHKELPISIKPLDNDFPFFGNFEISFTDMVFVDKEARGQTSCFVGDHPLIDCVVVLEHVQTQFAKANELAKEFVFKIKKGDYI